jgi:TRAP-type C4-dicarboxylate transport system permease small subunit
MTGKAKYFEDFVQKASSWLNWVTIVAFVVMAIITTADVIGAKLFGKPILISFDIVSYAGLLAVVPAIAWIQANHGHIEVELLTKRMSLHAQNVLACIMNILGIVLFTVMTWQMMDYGLTLQRTNRVSSIAELPMAPFAYFTVLCFVMVIAVLVAQTLVLLNTEVKK